jgi:catechol 2,3-dioxygenase-like lactoylglutathione lyase family enzyme
MPTAPFGLSRIGQIAQTVDDLERATTFYRDRLGLPFLYSFGSLAFFDCAGVRLMLSTPETAALDRPGSTLYFRVDDIDAAYRTLDERGIAWEGQPHMVGSTGTHDVWMAFFHDGEGNLLALMEER